ncbi:hypothetical protein GQ54DRAFT_171802 [Martensiomyces pterosporus]|nr:hypothetical protein GQ54DRAFT_171802 [Martensiomyces pterosporus]
MSGPRRYMLLCASLEHNTLRSCYKDPCGRATKMAAGDRMKASLCVVANRRAHTAAPHCSTKIRFLAEQPPQGRS